MIATLALSIVLVPQGNVSSGNLIHAPTTVFVGPATAEANGMGEQSAGHYKAAGSQVAPPIHYPALFDRP